MKSYKKSEELFDHACTLMPGGVNSPVRAFASVEGKPVFFEKGKGALAWDVDGNEYVDFCGSWGPLILGHAPDEVIAAIQENIMNGTSFGVPTSLENELASLIIDNNRFVDKVRFVNSGTEAVMSALRLARGVTGKSKIVKFEGCYHGHVDSMLVKAGSGLATLGTSSSAGIPEAYAKETLVLPLNDKEALDQVFSEFGKDIAAVIIEPIPANNGLLIQGEDFLKHLREVCTKNCTLLIFDEVISGFRVGFEGAAGLYNIEPDLLTFGKIIGGGLPVGAYAGKEGFMNQIAPMGKVYQAGTLSGNPVAMAAGVAQLTTCLTEGFYDEMASKTKKFVDQLNENLADSTIEVKNIGSIFWFFQKGENIVAASQLNDENTSWYYHIHRALLHEGIYLGPSAYEVGFVSAAHTSEMLSEAANTISKVILEHLK